MKIAIKKKINVFGILLAILIFLNLLSHLLRYYTESTQIISITNNLCWSILLAFACLLSCKNRVAVRKKEIWFLLILLISTFISWVYGQSVFPVVSDYLLPTVFFLISIFCTFFLKWNVRFGIDTVCSILKLIVVWGFLAVGFALVVQYTHLMNYFQDIQKAASSWAFSSFFSQRNIYAQYCLICVGSCIFLFEYLKEKKYALFAAVFAVNIYIADSQTSIYGTLFLVAMYVYLKSRHKAALICLVLVAIISALLIFTPTIHWAMFSRHYDAASGLDSASLRLSMWKQGFEELSSHMAWIQGFGKGSANAFLFQRYSYGSFHSAYVDILFEGGIVCLAYYVGTILYSICLLRKSSNLIYKNAMLSLLLSICFIGLVESGAAFYMSNYFGVTTTILLILIPRTIACNDRKDT